jgi:hypothetical protein
VISKGRRSRRRRSGGTNFRNEDVQEFKEGDPGKAVILALLASVSKSMILIIFKVVIIINDFFFHLNHNQIKVIMIKS